MNTDVIPPGDLPKPGSISWPNVHPDFDGHLEWPIERMSTEQRLNLLTDMAWLAYWGRQSRLAARRGSEHHSGHGQHDDKG